MSNRRLRSGRRSATSASSTSTPIEVIIVEDSSEDDDRTTTQHSRSKKAGSSNSRDERRHMDKAHHTVSATQDTRNFQHSVAEAPSTSTAGERKVFQSQHTKVGSSNSRDERRHRDKAQHTVSISQEATQNMSSSQNSVVKAPSTSTAGERKVFESQQAKTGSSNWRDKRGQGDEAQQTVSTSQEATQNMANSHHSVVAAYTSIAGQTTSAQCQRPKVMRSSSPITLDSDDDEHYYSNIYQRIRKKVHKKKKSKKPEIDVTAVQLPHDDSFSVTSTEQEPPLIERVRMQVEKENMERDAEFKKVADDIRARALVYNTNPCTSRVYFNPVVEETRKTLRVIHAIERNLETPLSAKSRSGPKVKVNEKTLVEKPQLGGDVVYVTVQDFEAPSKPHLKFKWPMDETFEKLKETMAEQWDVPNDPERIRIEESGTCTPIYSGNSPRNMKYRPFQSISFNAIFIGKKIPRMKKDPTVIELMCRTESNHRLRKIEVDKDATFADIKAKLMEVLKISTISKIVFDDSMVNDDATAISLGMEEGDTLDVYP